MTVNPGPKLDFKNLDILIRFSIHQLTVTAGIEKCSLFLMISIVAKVRDFFPILWL